MDIQVGKYTTFHSTKDRDFHSHGFMIRFSKNPAEIFSTQYFTIERIIQDSIYMIKPSNESQYGSYKVSISKHARKHPYYLSFGESALPGLDDIKRFKSTMAAWEVLPTGIKLLLPNVDERQPPREKRRAGSKSRRANRVKRRRGLSKSRAANPAGKPHATTSSTDKDSLIEIVSKQIKSINEVVANLKSKGIEIFLRIEGNTVRASMKSEI